MRKVQRIVNLIIIIIILWASTLSVQASSFEFNAIAEKEEVNVGDIVKIDLQVAGIDVKEGINVLEASLAYDETVFESVAFKNTNGWITTYCTEEGENKGKFVIVKLVEGVTQEETIGQIQLKLKDNVEVTETQIQIKNAISNDGIELMNEGNRTIKIKILKGQNGNSNGGQNGDQNGNSNGGQNGDQNGSSNGGQNGAQNGSSNGGWNGDQNGSSNGGQNGAQNGSSNGGWNGDQNGSSNGGQNGAQNGSLNGGQNGDQNGSLNGGQNGNSNGGQNGKQGGTITGDNINTGDSIALIVIIVTILIGINLIYFIIKRKQLETEEGKEKCRKRMLILAIVSILLMIIVIFLAKDIIAFEEEEIEAMIQQLKSQNKDNPESEEYLVTDETISRVKPGTTIKMLKTRVENVEVIDGQDTSSVKTGMIAKYGENGRTYEISVVGDINADGILNQIDLTREIREYVKSEKWRLEKEVEKISADVNFDKEIDEKDISTIINYVLYGELQVKEVEKVIAPKMEIISGLEVEEGRYISSVTVKITQENEETKTAKTIYEITGSKTTPEKEINGKQEEIELTEAGVFKITSYTYGIDGNKSKGSDIIIVIEGPEVKINTDEWTNQNITVTIEGKEGYEVEYKIGDGEWQKYDKEFEIDENCEITTRLTKDDIYGVEIKKEITNIDKEKPTGKIQVASTGSGRLVLEVEGQDAKLSGIKEIRVYVKEKTSPLYECKATYNYEEDPDKNDLKQESFILTGLDAATAYDIYIEVEDRAGNIYNKNNTERDENTMITTTTKEMATPVFVTTPVGWTNGNVEVAIEADEEYKIEYKINNGDWKAYTDALKIADNCTITARLTEPESTKNVSEATKEINNIDKLAPNDFTPIVSSTTNSITMTGSTTDQEGTGTDGKSGIEKYYFSKDNGETWEPAEGQTETTYIFENLTQGTAYNLKMKAVDKAGNKTIADVITKETTTVPDLTDSNTIISYSTTDITNKDVIVTIVTTAGSGYTLQYSKDNINWYDYETAVTMSQNGDIYARLRDSTGQGGQIKKGNVSNIDKLPPNMFTATVTDSTTCRITITGNTTDQAETEAYVSSGIAKYYYSKDDGETWEPTGGQTETSYTFDRLIQNTTYSLKIKAVDNAGNETITTNSLTQTTGTLPNLTDGNTTFSYSTTELTNQDVIVTITTTETTGILQYSKDGSNWVNYTTPVAMTQNGNIYARMGDGTNAGATTQGKVENIDKLAPNNFTPTVTSTTNKITIIGSTTDQVTTEAYACSGLDKYYFSKDNGATWEPVAGQTDTSYTFSNLPQNTTYSLKMKAVDKVGNEMITSTITKATGSVPTLEEANINILPNNSLPTTENVVVTIGTPTQNEYKVLYATSNPENEDSWSEYTGPITMTENGVVYTRLVDSVGNVGGYATLNVTNIDRLPPNAFTSSTLTATSTKNSITVTANTTDQKDENGYAGSGIAGYSFSIDNGATWTAWQTSGQYTFSGLTTGTYTVLVKAKDKAGHEIQGSITQEVVDLSLSSTSGKVISGNSVSVTVSGGNYGTLSCSSSNTSIATATLSGTTLTVRGVSTANGTQTATITVTGSKGGTATYTIQSHVHYGSSTSGGGCYGSRNTGTRTCGGTRTGVGCGGTFSAITCGGSITANTGTCGGTALYLSSGIEAAGNDYWYGVANFVCQSCGYNFTIKRGPWLGSVDASEMGGLVNTVQTCTRTVTKSYSCKSCGTTYSTSGTCTKILSYSCNRCGATSSSAGTCSRILSYRCTTCGATSSSGGTCTNQTTYTYYTMNCGF